MKFSFNSTLRNRYSFKAFSIFTACLLIGQILTPTIAFSLTSGPAQEEYASFEPAVTTDMVDLYSGDFNYNIPLLSVPGPNGGYPINLAYHSGIGMEQEASWVGLGWNVNVGAINRQVQGLPDDYNGRTIEQFYNLKKNETWTLSMPELSHSEFFGVHQGIGPLGFQIYYNNYKGLGYRVSYSLPPPSAYSPVSLGMAYDSQGGLDITPSLSLGVKPLNGLGINGQLSASYNSNYGLRSYGFSVSASASKSNPNSSGVAGSVSRGFNFGTNHYVPSVTIPMKNNTQHYGFKLSFVGTFGIWYYGPLNLEGIYESQEVSPQTTNKSAYGYNYAQHAGQNDIKDFSRKGIPYSKKIPNLAPSKFTYDLYNVTGQGVGGMFRPYRSEVGVLSDPVMQSTGSGDKDALEFGFWASPALNFHGGYSESSTSTKSISGPWRDGVSSEISSLEFKDKNTSEPEFEPFYYQMYGQSGSVYYEEDILYNEDGWQGEEALRAHILRPQIPNSNGSFSTSDKFVNYSGGDKIHEVNKGFNVRQKRQRRAENIRSLTEDEYREYGNSRNYKYFDGTNWVSKTSDSHHGSNTSEITVYKADGMRYTYGLPSYNNKLKTVSFRVWNGLSFSPNAAYDQPSSRPENITRIDGWHSGGQISSQSQQSSALPLDGYVSKNTVDEYPNSWMLTSITSADYVDLSGDGPTDDDLGYWVKFNYEKKHDDFQWRLPYTDASYQCGGVQNYFDDMGSYTYGSKEIFYLHSIETKTHAAFFILQERNDGREANGEVITGHQVGSDKSYALEQIKLYTKNEFGDIYGSFNQQAVPVKTVNFEYSYDLCSGIPNSSNYGGANDGKLTLKKLYFSNYGSTRGELTPYEFHYSTNNPSYDTRNMDRWGNYKDNDVYTDNGNDKYPYALHPYTDQYDSPISDAWHLTQIDLPTGAVMKINYESDDYAYVENLKPMQMFDIIGLATLASNSDRFDENVTSSNRATGSLAADDGAGRYKVYIQMSKPLPTELQTDAERRQYFADNYLKDYSGQEISKIYFDITLDLLKNLQGGGVDRIRGYADIDGVSASDIGVFESSPGVYDLAYIHVKPEPLSGVNVWGEFIHPFRVAAFQHIQMSRPELLNGQHTNWQSLYKGFTTVLTMAAGFNKYCKQQGYSTDVWLNGFSKVRLYCPIDSDNDYLGKYGGGNRTQKITIQEEDFTTTSGTNIYGHIYDYTIKENGKVFSSGVAYEPVIGMEESTLRQPIEYNYSIPLKQPQALFLEKPILDEFYPSASVGYRKVTVKTLTRSTDPSEEVITFTDDQTGDDQKMFHTSAQPVMVHEFYSPKEFPVISRQTDLTSHPAITSFSFSPGSSATSIKKMARSQGYSIVLNDMAGKVKRIAKVVPAISNLDLEAPERILYEEEHSYFTKKNFDPHSVNELKNVVKVLDEYGESCHDSATLGVTHDIWVDMNENYDESNTQGTDWNLEFTFMIPQPVIPPFLLALIPIQNNATSKTSFKTIVTNKVVYKTGLLKSIKVNDGDKQYLTENMVFDGVSGEPLLTKKNTAYTNNYSDAESGFEYSLELPAQWQYDGMRGNYKNLDFELSVASTATNPSNGELDLGSTNYQMNYAKDVFADGDKVLLNGTTYAHIYKRDTLKLSSGPPLFSNKIYLIDECGMYINQTITTLKVVESGRKNLISTKMANILALKNPLWSFDELIHWNCIALPTDNLIEDVFQTSAIKFSDEWSLSCIPDNSCSSGYINPYATGMKGRWYPKEQYAFNPLLRSKQYTNDSEVDGLFDQVWFFNWSDPNAAANQDWECQNIITKYSENGIEIETYSKSDIYHSASYGYGGSLVTAIAKNSRTEQFLFDGFEDYSDFDYCGDVKWDLVNPLSDLISSQSHSGDYALKVSSSEKSITIPIVSSYCNESSPKYSEGISGLQYSGCGIDKGFQPRNGDDYFISVWVKENNAPLSKTNYTDAGLVVEATGTSTSVNLLTKGEIINGWQKMEGRLIVPTGATGMAIKFKKLGAQDVYFDDFRIHPFKAEIESFVYHPIHLKPTAKLDNNNFATFFIYNDQGQLVKINKETERGIRTLSEGRSGIAQN